MKPESTDVILVGGGLANGLIAYRLMLERPATRFLILEREKKLGGEHTWSFHTSDLSDKERAWISPLVTKSWPSYRAIFPAYERTLGGGYHSVTSKHFHEVLTAKLGDRIRCGTGVHDLRPGQVTLDDGTIIEGGCVIDGRGFDEGMSLPAGYQKFLGMDLVLEEPHGEKDPILMDGRAEQKGGLRFFYTLPWSEKSIQLGEARYSDEPDVPREEFRAAVREYAKQRGWKIASVVREEVGVLPAPFYGDVWDLHPSAADEGEERVATSGVRAGLFHMTTGYSLPYAVRFAEAVAKLPTLDTRAVLELADATAQKMWNGGWYFRLLNRMLFRGADPHQRLPMFQQFYTRPEGLIQRFYVGNLLPQDYVRIMFGKPPISLTRAAKVFLTRD